MHRFMLTRNREEKYDHVVIPLCDMSLHSFQIDEFFSFLLKKI